MLRQFDSSVGVVAVKIGILAVQGDFEAHAAMLAGMGVVTVEVRTPLDLENCDGLVLPGGESTTQLQFLQEEGLYEAIQKVKGDTVAAINVENFAGAMRALAELRAPVDAFFDKVTVNAPDAALRANRLALLSEIRAATLNVADFSKIAG